MTSNHPLQPTQKQRPLSNPCHLFLSRRLLVSLILCSLLPCAPVSGLTPCVSELPVCAAFNGLGQIALANLLDGGVDVDDGQTLLEAGHSLLGTSNLLLGRVTLLLLSGLAGEEDQAGTVLLEAGNVGGERFVGEVLAAGVNSDTDRGRKLAGDASFLCTVRIVRTFQSLPYSPTFSSARVKPRPARTRLLYLIVGHRTMGLSLSTGRGATAAAFERRALRRLSFRPG